MISLIGKELAKKNEVFMFYGLSNECEKCRFRSTCIDPLEEGRKYIIKEVKDVEQKCPLHEQEKVKVVIIEKAPITALVDSKKAFEGSVIHFEPIFCENENFKELCAPEGLKEGDKCKIVKDLGKFKELTIKDNNFNKVQLEILDE